jgi:hypothetical protein
MKELLRQQLDFLRDFYGEMDGSAAMRRRYKLYLRAAFDNVSAFHTGLFVHLLGRGLQGVDSDALTSWVRDLDPEKFPELEKFPNRHHVTRWGGDGPLGASTQLPEKFDALREERDKLKSERAALREILSLVTGLQSRRGAALGRLLGTVPSTDGLPGRTAVEKLEALRKRLGE